MFRLWMGSWMEISGISCCIFLAIFLSMLLSFELVGICKDINILKFNFPIFRYLIWKWKEGDVVKFYGQWRKCKDKISFPTHWGVGRMPVPPPSDLLATINLFEQQIKAEPITFYSTCPPPPPGATAGPPTAQMTTTTSQHIRPDTITVVSNAQQQQQQNQQPQHQQQSVITTIDTKNNLIHPQIILVGFFFYVCSSDLLLNSDSFLNLRLVGCNLPRSLGAWYIL